MALELSPISAVSYQILQSSYEALNLDHARQGSDDLSFQYNASELMRQENGADKLEARLDVHVSPSGESPSGYKLDIAVRGMFVATYAEESGTTEDFEMFMKVNAFTLLYAFIRSHVQMLTSMTPSAQVCLPCLDVNSIVEILSQPPVEDTEPE